MWTSWNSETNRSCSLTVVLGIDDLVSDHHGIIPTPYHHRSELDINRWYMMVHAGTRQIMRGREMDADTWIVLDCCVSLVEHRKPIRASWMEVESHRAVEIHTKVPKSNVAAHDFGTAWTKAIEPRRSSHSIARYIPIISYIAIIFLVA